MERLPAEFFESYPLYKKCESDWMPTHVSQLEAGGAAYPTIRMPCKECKTTHTMIPTDFARDAHWTDHQSLDGLICSVNYFCPSCRSATYKFLFMLHMQTNQVEKLGQYPSWSIAVPATLEKCVSPDVCRLYKKGCINESQGYGIGAFSYYRRVVESVIAELLTDIGELIESESGKEEYKRKLAGVVAGQSAEPRIAVVKDLLPSILRPNGTNPLSVLYSALSDGLHSRTDDECLELAAAIRYTLLFLLEQVSSRKKTTQDYVSNMNAILTKLAKRGDTKTDVK